MQGSVNADTPTGYAMDDVINGNGGEGADSFIGGLGKDTYTLTETTAAIDTLVIAVGDSLLSNFDVVNGFKPGNGTVSTAGVDKLDIDSPLVAASVSAVNGIDSGIIRSHSIVNGFISFDDIDVYTTPLTASNLPSVYSYLQNNVIGVGNIVAFTAGGNSYVFQDEGVNDTLVQLAGVGVVGISITGLGAGAVWIV